MIALGPRASLLLGMLADPATTEELLVGVERALTMPDVVCDCQRLADAITPNTPGGGSALLSLRSISDGGVQVVEALLDRLKDSGFVDVLVDPDGVKLWRRLPWPAA